MAIWNRKKRTPEKFIGYYELLAAMGQPGCAVCTRIDRAGRTAIDAMLYESVNDPGVRADLQASGGFCHGHAVMAAENGDAYGLSILYEDLIHQRLDALNQGTPSLEDNDGTCPICRTVEACEERALGLFCEHLQEAELAAALDRADPLCFRHYEALRARLPSPGMREVLYQWELRALGRLRSELAGFIRKGDYHFQHEEVTREEATAWRRAMEWFVGKLPAR